MLFFKLSPKKAPKVGSKPSQALKGQPVVLSQFGPRVTHALLKAEKKKIKEEN